MINPKLVKTAAVVVTAYAVLNMIFLVGWMVWSNPGYDYSISNWKYIFPELLWNEWAVFSIYVFAMIGLYRLHLLAVRSSQASSLSDKFQ